MSYLKNKYVIGGIVLFIIIAGIIIKKSTTHEAQTFKLEKGNMIEATYGVGTVKSDHVYNLKTGVNTKMIERFVQIGQRVKKGDKLLRLETFPLYTAPFDGVITSLNYEVGELVFSSSSVLTLVNDKALYLELNLDEKSINKIKVGNATKVTFDNQKIKTEGHVRAIFSNNDQFYVHVNFEQKELVLLPGMTCDVSIITKKYTDVVLVPLEAITSEDKVVFADKTKQPVKLDIIFKNNKYAAVSNLSEGDVVISSDDSPVKYNRSNKAKSSGGAH